MIVPQQVLTIFVVVAAALLFLHNQIPMLKSSILPPMLSSLQLSSLLLGSKIRLILYAYQLHYILKTKLLKSDFILFFPSHFVLQNSDRG